MHKTDDFLASVNFAPSTPEKFQKENNSTRLFQQILQGEKFSWSSNIHNAKQNVLSTKLSAN